MASTEDLREEPLPRSPVPAEPHSWPLIERRKRTGWWRSVLSANHTPILCSGSPPSLHRARWDCASSSPGMRWLRGSNSWTKWVLGLVHPVGTPEACQEHLLPRPSELPRPCPSQGFTNSLRPCSSLPALPGMLCGCESAGDGLSLTTEGPVPCRASRGYRSSKPRLSYPRNC